MKPEGSSITSVLVRLSAGERGAFDELVARTYGELRVIADALFAMQPSGHTLQATALLNEAVMKLMRGTRRDWNDRKHFFAAAARTMRCILVDYSLSRKRPEERLMGSRLHLDEVVGPLEAEVGDIDALNAALERLETFDPVGAQLVEYRFFLRLPMEMAAEMIGMPLRTAEREWSTVRAWLRQELRHDA